MSMGNVIQSQFVSQQAFRTLQVRTDQTRTAAHRPRKATSHGVVTVSASGTLSESPVAPPKNLKLSRQVVIDAANSQSFAKKQKLGPAEENVQVCQTNELPGLS